jgi:hypothetical protein
MAAVAVAAITSWWLAMSGIITPLVAAPVGPILGLAYIMSRVNRTHLLDFLPATIGGVVQAGLLLTAGPLLSAWQDPTFPVGYTASARKGFLPVFVCMPSIAVGVLHGVAAWESLFLTEFITRLTNSQR